MKPLELLKKDLDKLADSSRAKLLQKFFKTGKGEYGEGDLFLGITVPDSRSIAKHYSSVISLADIKIMLQSKFHEERLAALLILVDKYEKSTAEAKPFLADFYLSNSQFINNWDLVDLSAPKILGDYLLSRSRAILYELSQSKNVWKRRIAIISTFIFIRNNQFADTLKLSELLMNDSHDLIHKAIGWMLREVGKKDEEVLTSFLDDHYKRMPRTMLRYAIERLSKEQKEHYMKK